MSITGRKATVSSLRGNAGVMALMRAMQTNADKTNKEFARLVGLSQGGFSQLQNNLRALGMVERIVAILNPHMMGVHATAFFEFQCSQPRAVKEWLTARPEVLEVHWLGGPVLIKVKAEDYKALQDFKENLGAVPGVSALWAKVALVTTKETTALPI